MREQTNCETRKTNSFLFLSAKRFCVFVCIVFARSAIAASLRRYLIASLRKKKNTNLQNMQLFDSLVKARHKQLVDTATINMAKLEGSQIWFVANNLRSLRANAFAFCVALLRRFAMLLPFARIERSKSCATNQRTIENCFVEALAANFALKLSQTLARKNRSLSGHKIVYKYNQYE